jgi:hypothetical protein
MTDRPFAESDAGTNGNGAHLSVVGTSTLKNGEAA